MKPLQILLSAIALLLFSTLSAQKVYMKVTSSKSGVIKDQNMPAQMADKIELTGYSFDASSPVSGTGAASGRQTHSPLIIFKNSNQSSIQLLAAQSKGEILSKVVLEIWKVNPQGKETMEQTIELSNAMITFFRQGFDNNPAPGGNKGPTDEIRFAYQKITYTYVNGGITAEDNW